jgi:hypothetical protein
MHGTCNVKLAAATIADNSNLQRIFEADKL